MINKIKIFLPFILIIIIIVISFKSYNNAKFTQNEPISVIPVNSSIIFKLNKVNKLNYFLNKNTIWSKLKNITPIKNADNFIKQIEKFISKNKIKPSSIYITITSDGASNIGYLLSTELTSSNKAIVSNIFKLNSNNSIIFDYDNFKIHTYENDTTTNYISIIDNILCYSSSKTIIEDAIKSHNSDFNLLKNDELTNLFKTSNNNSHINVFYNINNLLTLSNNILKVKNKNFQFGNWVANDLMITNNLILLSGLSSLDKNINNYTDIFINQKQKKINVTKIIPSNTTFLKAISFNNIKKLNKNSKSLLEKMNEIWSNEKHQKNIFSEYNFNYPELINKIEGEAGIFSCDILNNNSYIYFKVKESIHAYSLLQPLINNDKSTKYLNYNINYINDSKLPSTIFPFPQFKKNANFFTVINNYFFFSDNIPSLEYLIENYVSKNTLIESKYFNNFNNAISSESNIFYYLNSKIILENINNYFINDIININQIDSLEKITSIAFQISNNSSNLLNSLSIFHDEEFSENLKEKWFVQIDTTSNFKPQIVYNHKIKANAIMIQDYNNKLYYITENKENRWHKELDDKIIGDISFGDFFKNKKAQMIFNTSKDLYMLDVFGRDVDSYPIKIDNSTNLSHSLFDYNNTKKYRVLIPTNKQIINLDKKGKKVFGWKHQKQTESINNTLEHFKIKNKDFIISQSENGIKLLAINGSERLKFDISIINNSLQRDDYGNLFAITNDLKLWQGDINGLSTIINVSEIDSNSLLQIIDNNIVISFENKLKILNKKLEEVGDYKLDSKIIRIDKYKNYLSIGTKQNIYLLKDNKIVEGTPIKTGSNYNICNLEDNLNIIVIRNKVLFNYELKQK
jgi:hypothetical protein